MSDGHEVRAAHLVLDHRTTGAPEALERLPEGAPEGTVHSIEVPAEGRSLRSVEAELVRVTLDLTAGNKSAAARILGISRPTLHKKIGEYGIVPR